MEAKRFAILGDGSMGTACAMLLAQKPEHEVAIWCQFPENAAALRRDRENKRFLPGVSLDERIGVESEFSAVADSDVFVLAIPMIYLAKTLEPLASSWANSGAIRPMVSVVKGIEQGTFRRASQIVESLLPDVRCVVLSGPMHAEEIARGMFASCVSACGDIDLARKVQHWFSGDTLRVYASHDLKGTELGGALKNVIAIAAGICDGAEFGDNAKSALMTRGLVEMTRFGLSEGARAETFHGLAGLGDLITTCISSHGRNRHVGERLGKGEKLDSIIDGMVQVAEGVWTTRGVWEMAQSRGIEMPVTEEVYRILFEDKDVRTAVRDLMRRPLSAE